MFETAGGFVLQRAAPTPALISVRGARPLGGEVLADARTGVDHLGLTDDQTILHELADGMQGGYPA